MIIKSFTIRNYRSIRELKIDGLQAINVFFGKNNVGKSNILRALHLGFFCLKYDKFFLPDTTFFNRNIYKPIEIVVNLFLSRQFRRKRQPKEALGERLEKIRVALSDIGDQSRDFSKNIDRFINASNSFEPIREMRLKIDIGYGEETSDVKVSIESPTHDYSFDYGHYKMLYHRLLRIIAGKTRAEEARKMDSMLIQLSEFGVDTDELIPFRHRKRLADYGVDPHELEMILDRLERQIGRIKDSDLRRHASYVLQSYTEELQAPEDELTRSLPKVFNVPKQYFDEISDSFILIPNKEYFLRGPLDEKGGEQIQIFNMDKFMERLLFLIQSPNKRERELIERFFSVFNKSYAELGKLETVTRLRNQIFVIFGTSITSLPIGDQGLGIQDLFLYIAHMILFDSTVVAIEEPEGGLSTENQRVLQEIVEAIYSRRGKQILISSHSEVFETPNSYIIEMDRDGTKEISRVEKEKEYEEKIDNILIQRSLAREKEEYAALLSNVAQRQMTLDVLQYISKLSDEETVDPQEISNKLGYPKEKVEEILKQAVRKK